MPGVSQNTIIMKQLIFFLFSLSAILFISCQNKCQNSQVADLKFSDEELKINPYTGKERLTYFSSANDTIVFQEGDRSSMSQKYLTDPNSPESACRNNYYYGEVNYMYKNSENSFFTITLSYKYTDFYKNDLKKVFLLNIGIKKLDASFYGSFTFGQDTLMNGTSISSDSIVDFQMTKVIGPNTFYEVYELQGQKEGPKDTAWISIVFYSIKQGLVGFQTNNGNVFYSSL
jgi:hypothetical protein